MAISFPTIIPLSNSVLYQSGYIYAQAAGSDGTDKSAPGFHLRWSFSRELAEKHLAKGNLAATPSDPYYTTIGYNKPNDFIALWRIEYKPNNQNKTFPANVNLLSQPTQLIETGSTREWRWLQIATFPNTPSNTDVILRFSDKAQYDTLRATINPNTSNANRDNFLRSYTGMLEVETPGKLFFSAIVNTKADGPSGNAIVKAESVSTPDSINPSDKTISCRHKFTGGEARTFRIICENIQYIRFVYSGCHPVSLAIETYQDFILGSNAFNKWDFIGQFSLSIDDNTVFKRLENTVSIPSDPTFSSVYLIDKKWPKYNDVDTATGAFTVKVQNYRDRWGTHDPNPPDPDGLKNAVLEYLDKSRTNLLANSSLPATQAPNPALPDSAHLNISYLKMLNLAGLDYHVARQLGLGHIDAPNGSNNKIFIYVAQYFTNIKPADFPPQNPPLPSNIVFNHLYMTLPTRLIDYRLPPPPVQDSLTYGIVDTSSVPPVTITSPDGSGYSLFDDSRFINVNKQPFDLEVPFGTFYSSDKQFCICEVTKPVLFGIDYRKQGETDFRKPELSNDPDFLDYTSRPETVPILEHPNPLFIHQEKEEGVHDYAIYGINWFSRPSVLSNIKSTDFTVFLKKNTLVPPLNFAVQLIQPESPRIFTTLAEQQKLLGLNTTDKTLVRLTFDWNNVHNTAYQYATYAEFFFRENAPLNVRGKLVTVSNPNVNHEVVVTTQPFTITTVNGTETIQPNILPADINKYLNGLLSTEDGSAFIITAINSPVNGNNPTITLKQVKKTQSVDPNNTNTFSTVQSYTSPGAGLRFMIVENLAAENNWTSLLKKRVGLIHYGTVDFMKVTGSTLNNGKYTVKSVMPSGPDSDIVVKESIPGNAVNGNVEFSKTTPIVAVDVVNKIFTVKGDVTTELAPGLGISVLLSEIGDGAYTVSVLSLNGVNTDIAVVETIPLGTAFGNVVFNKVVPVSAIDQVNKKFTVTGNIAAELVPSHKETVINADGSEVEYNRGGVFEKAQITQRFDPDPNSIGFPNSPIGVYEILFNTFLLPPHPDPQIDWYKGLARIPAAANPSIIKELQVWEIKTDTSTNTTQLIVYDPEFTTDPIITGLLPLANVDINFHPSYRLYLTADDNPNTLPSGANNFDASVILPLPGGNTKQTFMSARSIDTTTIDPNPSPHPYESYLNTPVILLAREIVEPEPPEEPTGPLFATRPDFYGKSTYTLDTKVKTMVNNNPRKPYALIFYRANERRILDVLYKPATVDQVIADLAALQSPDADFLNNRWKDLVNGIYDFSTSLFKEYVPGGYRFPLPDNDQSSIVDPAITDPNVVNTVKPFATSYTDLSSTFNGDTIINWAKKIMDAAFLPLSEQPVIFNFVKPGIQTSGKKPVTRDGNGDLLSQSSSVFEPFPMAVKYAKLTNGGVSTLQADVDNASNDIFVRFTDFTLDGAAKNIYFYYAIELTNNFELGPRSSIMGPVQLVNAMPAETPEIKKVTTQLSDPLLGIPTAVLFNINTYIESENIRKIQIYRATNQADSLTIRTMSLAKTVDVGDEITDDFSDVNLPPFGDPLFYRIIALREIMNEQFQTEFVPSKPSNMVLTNIVDNVNPPAPQISYTSDPPTGSPIQLNNVILSWPKTAHNSTYHLYKMNASGNWIKIYTIKTNAAIVAVPLTATDLASGTLNKQDADLNTIYTRFRVQVVNSSGLLNIEQKELTI